MNYYKKIYRFIIVSLLAFAFFACGEMDATYEEFLEGGEYIYPGKIDSICVYPGKYRIGLSWENPVDPTVSSTIIYWDNEKDSMEFEVDRSNGLDSVFVVIDNLSERSQTFTAVTVDDEGNRSVKSEVIGTVYGNLYRNSLLVRGIEKLSFSEDVGLTIDWAAADEEVQFQELNYTDSEGINHEMVCNLETDQIILSDYDADNGFYYNTVFKPEEAAIDTFKTAWQHIQPELVSKEAKIDKSLFSLYELPGDYSVEHNSSSPISNIWSNPDETTSSPSYISLVNGHPLPQWFTLDLGKKYSLTKISIYQRGDSGANSNRFYAGGNVKSFEVWGSANPDINYNPDDHEGVFDDSWTLLSVCEVNRPSGNTVIAGSSRADNTQEDIDAALAGHEFELEDHGKVRYLRVKVLEDWHSANDYVNIAAISLKAFQYSIE